MTAKRKNGDSEWVDPDDAPELDDVFFDGAEIRKGEVLIRRGRPRLDNPKSQITLRLDQDVIAHFKATGSGWQSRINETLRLAVPRKR